MTDIDKFHGLKYEEVTNKLGQPDTSETFRMEDDLSEFRIELLNTYPLDKVENRKVVIREETWNDGDYRSTLWFSQAGNDWKVISGLRWHKDTDF